MRSANRLPDAPPPPGATVLFGGFLSTGHSREVPVSPQNAPSQEENTHRVINNFNEAFNRHDADALSAFLTDDTVLPHRHVPCPRRPPHRRQSSRRRLLARLVRAKPRRPLRRRGSHRHRRSRRRALGLPQNAQWPTLAHPRRSAIFTVRHGKVAAKLAYVKG